MIKIHEGTIKLNTGEELNAYFFVSGKTILRIEPYGTFSTAYEFYYEFYHAYQGLDAFNKHIEKMNVEFDHVSNEAYLKACLNKLNEHK